MNYIIAYIFNEVINTARMNSRIVLLVLIINKL